MEFTRYERRLLDPRFPSRSRIILSMGIISVVISLTVLLMGSRIAERLYKPFEQRLSNTQNITVESQREEILKQSLIETLKVAELGWRKYAESVRQQIFFLLFSFGVVVIVGWWHNNRVYRLLKKLNIGPQQTAPPDRQ